MAFESAATNLVPGDTNAAADLFVGAGSLPVQPGQLTYFVSGSNVTFSWTAAGTGGATTVYIIEGGSASGLADVGTIATGTGTTFVVSGVGPGTYFVRVRATNGTGSGAASNEVVVTFSAALPPGAPTGLAFSVNGSTVTLVWSAPSTGGTSAGYVIEAGSSPGALNLAHFATGSTATTFVATGVPAGTYFVRIRAGNDAGIGPASNEIVLVVR